MWQHTCFLSQQIKTTCNGRPWTPWVYPYSQCNCSMVPYLAIMWLTYLSSVPKNKDYLQQDTLDPLGLLEHLEHQPVQPSHYVVLPCLKLSLIWHTKVKVKSDWSIKTYMKTDHNTIMPFGIKVMSKSKCEHGMIKNTLTHISWETVSSHQPFSVQGTTKTKFIMQCDHWPHDLCVVILSLNIHISFSHSGYAG